MMLSLAAVMTLMIATAPAATFDYTTLWAHLADVEVDHFLYDCGGLVDVGFQLEMSGPGAAIKAPAPEKIETAKMARISLIRYGWTVWWIIVITP